MNTEEILKSAYKNYGECAKSVTSRLGGRDPNPTESELFIAFGIAVDWCRRASKLEPLTYNGKHLNRQKRSKGVTEIIRFNMVWSGMNALFARQSILDLLPTGPTNSELQRFRILFNHSGINAADVNANEKTLRNILSVPITTRIPGVPSGAPVTTLHALHYKYTPIEIQTRGVGKNIKRALDTQNYSSLDLPILIYSMRNWSVHGGIIDSSFRNEDRFKLYIDTILKSLAMVHDGISAELKKHV